MLEEEEIHPEENASPASRIFTIFFLIDCKYWCGSAPSEKKMKSKEFALLLVMSSYA